MAASEYFYIIEEYGNGGYILLENEKIVFEVKRRARLFGKLYSSFFINQELVLETTIHNFLVIFGPSLVQIKFQKLDDQLSLLLKKGTYRLLYRDNFVDKIVMTNGSPYVEFYLNGTYYGCIYENIGRFGSPVSRKFSVFLGSGPIDNIYMIFFFLMELEPIGF